jgi:hypothetical protein
MKTFTRIKPRINFVAFIYASYQFLPVLPWLVKSRSNSSYLPYFPHQDTTYYLSLISSFLKGESGSPYFVDSEGAGAFSQVFPAIIGLGSKFLTTDIVVVWAVTVFISAYFFYILITSIVLRLVEKDGNTSRNLLHQISIAFFSFAIIGTQFQRVSPTQTGFVLFLLIINLVLKWNYNLKSPTLILPIIALGVINPFYGSVAGLIVASLFSRTFPITQIKRIVIFLLAGCLLVIGGNLIQVPTGDLVERLDFTVSHLPGAISSSVFLVILLITLWISWAGADKNVLEYQFIKYSTVVVLFLLNQQILTGITWEPESHLTLLIELQHLLIFLSVLKKLVIKEKSIVLTACALSIGLVFYSFTEIAELTKETRTKMILTEGQATIFKEIKKELYADQVILFKKPSFNQNQIATLGLLTKIKFYWHPNSVFLPVSTKELSQRYACTLENTEEFNYTQEANLFLGHKYLNNLAFHRKYSSFFVNEKRIINEIITMQTKERIQLTRSMNFEISKCLAKKYSYMADFVVTRDATGSMKIEKIYGQWVTR